MPEHIDIDYETEKSPETFGHPYKPYDIQLQFMKELYDTLQHKKVGIFESPTGTGKTLSLICGSVSWLRDTRRNQFETTGEDKEDEATKKLPAWVREQSKQMKQNAIVEQLKDLEAALKEAISLEETELREAQSLKRKRPPADYTVKRQKPAKDDLDSDFYVLQDQDESLDDDFLTQQEKELQAIKARTNALLQVLEEGPSTKDDQPVFGKDQPKIFFASRTHSQLSQFVGQLRLPTFKSSVPAFMPDEPIKEISLASRRQLCIHPAVSKYKSTQKMNDACLDMQKESCGCEYMLNMRDIKSRVRYREFRNAALAKIRDIEDLAQLGKTKRMCPYYATREIANNGWAEIIALPYQLLLQREARDALGINLTNSVVVIDEAHNLLDTISSLYSLELTYSQISRALTGLQTYQKKFQSRLSGINRIWLAKLIKTVTSIAHFLKKAQRKPPQETGPGKNIPASSFFANDDGAADTINVHDLEQFVKKTKLVFKIESYLDKLETLEQQQHHHLVLGKVISFLLAIGNPSWEGKFFYGRNANKELQVQYILLDPSVKFREIVDECRCVILAGGTMKPTEDYLTYLFPYLAKDQISIFSCNHIIPDKNLTVLPVGQRQGIKFNFTFGERNSKPMIEQLGLALIDICKTVPDGVVVFLPSYVYMNSVIKIWESSTTNNRTILGALKAVKSVFWEPQNSGTDSSYMPSVETAGATTKILEEYTKKIEGTTGRGAVLFAVVGGKMSEGINFSDKLARAVVMVGLPFPHAFSAEMVAKRDYVEQTTIKQQLQKNGAKDGDNPIKSTSVSSSLQQLGKAKAREYYENVCMRAVNQCVGRAIRHADDYAAVILLDNRYGTDHIQGKLSQWVQKRIVHGPNGGSLTDLDALSKLSAFFQR